MKKQKGRTFCSCDWHGCGTVAKKVLNCLQPDDTLYFLGDAIDRNPDGVEIFKTLISDKRVKMIKGNHEEMLSLAIPYIVDDYELDSLYYIHWISNGGSKTERALEKLPKQEILKIKRIIDKMPIEMIYDSPLGHSVILEHAGFSPFVVPHRTHEPLWDRQHFHDEWFGGYDYKGLDPETTYLVHGHTPVQYLQFEFGYKDQPLKTKEDLLVGRMWDSPEINWKPEVIRYCDNHKFDIDCCTVVSNRVALLDLDTFEVKYFDGE